MTGFPNEGIKDRVVLFHKTDATVVIVLGGLIGTIFIMLCGRWL